MTPTIRRAAFFATAALGAAAIATTAAWAQDAQHGQRPSPDQMHARMEQMREAHERQHAADLRTILRLRPDQEPALTAFLASHKHPGMDGKDGAGRPGDRHGPPGQAPGAMTTPQQLDAMDRRESEHAAMRKQHEDALRTFYAALSPEQRQVFDALQRMHGGHEHGGHESGGWAHGGHGGMMMHGPMGGPPGGPGGPPPRDD